ncbi:hypothetical protein [Streptomyces beigongshangae]|uniref:hypothetical protein n=1 Tax=Streptomyces beigongshangae TaxID=2841597 RepID=UPI001C84D1EF|nr:hypothetical protein [Streptomyces sp. REN17]
MKRQAAKPSVYDPPVGLPGMPVGSRVHDSATGRKGILRDIFHYQAADEPPGHDARPARRLVFLRPVGGGLEWTAEPDQVVPVEWNHLAGAPDVRPPAPADRGAD